MLKQIKVVLSSNIQYENGLNTIKGFTVIKVESIEASFEIIKSDSFLDINSTVRISQ